MIVVKQDGSSFKEISIGASFVGSDGALHPWQVAELWSDKDLATIGLYRVAPVPPPTDPRAIINGYTFRRIGGVVTQVLDVTPPPPMTKQELIAYAKDARWKKEVGGIFVSGVPIATDDRSKQMLIGARVAADADPNFSTEWSGADDQIYPLTAEQLIGISNAVLAHVATCFGIFANVKSQIDAETVTTPEQVDAAFM